VLVLLAQKVFEQSILSKAYSGLANYKSCSFPVRKTFPLISGSKLSMVSLYVQKDPVPFLSLL
jgi:hypothetical protein